MKYHLGTASLRAGICVVGIAVLATPALSQSPAGTGGGAGGESGSSSAMPAQQRTPVLGSELRPRFREDVVRETQPSFPRYRRYTWADIQGIRLMVRMP